MKRKDNGMLEKLDMAHPTRVRGLKQGLVFGSVAHFLSHPTRVRGLKQARYNRKDINVTVAPHAGAWIETCQRYSSYLFWYPVAPHAGAWIETLKRTASS